MNKNTLKNTLLIAVTLALSLSWVGCNKSGKLDTASTLKAPSGPVELKLKWPLGERIVQDFDMKQKMEILVPGQPASMKQDMTFGQKYSLTVLKEDAGGGHEVELEFLGVRMSMVMGGKTIMDYDSDKKPGGGGANPEVGQIAAMLQKIIGAKIQYFLNASNEVERIEGIDALVTRLGTGGRANGAASIKNMYNEGFFKQMIGSSQSMPPKPVQPGDTWPIKMEITMGDLGTMMFDYGFTFQSWEQHGKRNCARLEFQGSIKSKPDQTPGAGGMTMSISVGNSSGVSWFDPELGIITETTLNQDMTMLMTMPINARGNAAAAKTQTMTNLMSQIITIKLDSVK